MLVDAYYVYWREMKRLSRQKTRIVMSVIQPVVWLVLMGNMMTGLTNNPFAARMIGADSYLDFMTPGIMIMSALFGSVFGGVSIIWDRQTGFLNKMLAAPISRTAIPLGKMAGIASQAALQVIVIGIIALLLGVEFATGPAGFLLALVIIILFSFGVSGISLSLATILKTHESLFAVMNFVTLPMMFASNAIFPKAAMPSWLELIATYNPLSHAVTPIRTLIVQGWVWDRIINGLVVMALFALVMIIVSSRQFKRSVG
ncbi:MAG: ABC transporter permease [Peptococcaceae bacterium]|nr:ABC transporter permease [Peptococcaceae bacterium]